VLTVCVFAASSEAIPKRYVDVATVVGEELARRGHGLVFGGGSVSAMGEVARAARAAGARTVGVIPRGLVAAEMADTDADELVITDDMRSRKGEMDRRSDAFLALPGGLGTLEELLEVWVARSLGMCAKPVVVLDPDDTYAGLRALVDRLAERGFVRPAALRAVRWTTSPSEAVDRLEQPAEPLTGTAEDLLEAEP
jgi:uncharacterized protein (TIGR00730 family)